MVGSVRTWLSHNKAIIIIFFVALAIRLGAGIFYFHSDSIVYMRLAESIREGKLYAEHFWNVSQIDGRLFLPPLYPVIVAGVSFVIRNMVWAAMAVSLACNVLSLLLVYAIGKELFGHRVGLWAMGLMALFPIHISYALFILTESLFLLLFLSACYCLLRMLRSPDGLKWGVAAGIVSGLAFLTRTISLVVLVLAAGWALYHVLSKKIRMGQTMRQGVVIGVCFLVIVSPYILYLHHQTGRWLIGGQQDSTVAVAGVDRLGKFIGGSKENEQAYYRGLMSLNADGTEYSFLQNGGDTTSGSFLSYYALNALDNFLMLCLVNIPLLLLLLFYRWRASADRNAIIIVLTAVILQFLIVSVGRSNLRYLFGIMPFLVILTAYMYLSSRLYGNRIATVFVIVLTVIFWWLAPIVLKEGLANFGQAFHKESYPASNTVVQWTDRHFRGGDSIASFSPLYGYRNDLIWYRIPYAEPDQLAMFMRAKNISYIVLDPLSDKYYGSAYAATQKDGRCEFAPGFELVDSLQVIGTVTGGVGVLPCGVAIFRVAD